MDHRGWLDSPGQAVISRAFTLAAMSDGRCRPLHILAALAELDGPIGLVLRPGEGRVLYPGPTAESGRAGGAMSTYLCGQVQVGAQEYAERRAEPMRPEHLLVVVIDQADVEVMERLALAELDPTTVRRVALAELGEPLDRPILQLPAPTPAGTMDRPPLEIDELDPRAWAVLVWRQQHLPLKRIRRRSHWYGLFAVEERAAWKIADAADVDDDQRYSLLARHHTAVNALAYAAHPSIVDAPRDTAVSDRGGIMIGHARFRRRRLRRLVPNFMIGWPTWFGNRRAGMRDRWFRIRTLNSYLGQPKIPR